MPLGKPSVPYIPSAIVLGSHPQAPITRPKALRRSAVTPLSLFLCVCVCARMHARACSCVRARELSLSVFLSRSLSHPSPPDHRYPTRLHTSGVGPSKQKQHIHAHRTFEIRSRVRICMYARTAGRGFCGDGSEPSCAL